MNRKVALIISIIFHPVFVNLVSLFMLFTLFPILNYGLSLGTKIIYILGIFVPTGLFPVATVAILKMVGKAKSFLLDDREERTLPYVITAAWYLFDYFLAMKLGTPKLLTAFLLTGSSIVIAVLIINTFDKISIHAASLGAITGLLIIASKAAFIDTRFLFCTILLISGLTFTARMYAGAHKLYQLYSGYLLGIALMLFIL